MKYLVTLCIPTNGIVEWCIPVLDSIYNQGINEDLFQVVITDNGDGNELKKAIEKYKNTHINLVYKKTNAQGFLNQIESFKLAEGKMIKFINHRMRLKEGSLLFLINYAKTNDENTVTYFSNGVLHKNKILREKNFNRFMARLSYWSSWSAGLTFWNKDINEIKNIKNFNSLFPHTDILFMNKNAKEYYVVDIPLLTEVQVDDTKKGKYNLFYAFSNEYMNLILKLKNNGDISKSTYNLIYKDLKHFIGKLYARYILCKKPCSYDLSNAERNIAVYFSVKQIRRIGKRYVFIEKARNLLMNRLKKHI